MEYLSAAAQSLAERRSGNRHDHEFLDLNVVGSVSAAVEDVHHRHRQGLGVAAADVVVKRQDRASAAAFATARDTPRIAFAPNLVLFGVPSALDHSLVDRLLVESVHADNDLSDLAVDSVNSLQNAPLPL